MLAVKLCVAARIKRFAILKGIPSALLTDSQLESHPEIYVGYVPMDYEEYLEKMPKLVIAPFRPFIYKCLNYSIHILTLPC